MNESTHDGQVVEAGRTLAQAVIQDRMEVLKRGASPGVTMAAPGGAVTLEARSVGPAGRIAMAAARPRGYLIAEGDSWFDYPRSDVLDVLEDDHGYRVERLAHGGDTVEDMAFNESQIGALAKRFERLLQDRRPVDAVLLSGGGNDIAGNEFSMLLEHASSGKAAINAVIAEQVIYGRIRDAFLRIIGTVNAISEAYLDRHVPIILHGYGYPVADGRGFLGGAWFLPGPWLGPGFERKGISDSIVRRQVMRSLMDDFNAMLSALTSVPDLDGVVSYVDLRDLLSDDLANYRDDWANELHPTQSGFRRVAASIAAEVERRTES